MGKYSHRSYDTLRVVRRSEFAGAAEALFSLYQLATDVQPRQHEQGSEDSVRHEVVRKRVAHKNREWLCTKNVSV